MKSPLINAYWKSCIFVVLLLACQQEIHWDKEQIVQLYEVATIAGRDSAGIKDGDTSIAVLNRPICVAMDAAGNIYVTDRSSDRIRMVAPNSLVSTIAGRSRGFADGNAAEAMFSNPAGMVVDGSGNLYISDKENHSIRMLSVNGQVSTIAGNGTTGTTDGVGSAARFRSPHGITLDGAGNIYVADEGNHRIRKITPQGEVSTLAGSRRGFADGSGAAAQFNDPIDITTDNSGNLYVADRDNHRIRKIDPSGMVTTLAGTDSAGYVDGNGSSARFSFPQGVAIDRNGNVYVADSENHRIRKVNPNGQVSTLAGNGVPGFADGTRADAQFQDPRGIIIDREQKFLYIADHDNSRIRRIALQ